MMRTLFWLWLGPILVFWSWYFLSLADLGGIFLSRELHDQVFQIYGNLLDMDPAAIPPMIAKALAVDSLFVFALVLFRRRRQIIGWCRGRQGEASGPQRSEESLSNAP